MSSTAKGVDDQNLVRRFVENKDNDAFQVLVVRHLKSIRRILFSIFNGSIHDVEDAEQEILLKLFLKLHSFRFQSSFKTFLFSFVRNSGIDILRKKKKNPVSIDISTCGQVVFSQDPEEQVLKKERHSELLNALSELREEERSLLIMKDVEGMTIKQIAKVMGLPGGTVKSRLHRIRDKMVSILIMR